MMIDHDKNDNYLKQESMEFDTRCTENTLYDTCTTSDFEMQLVLIMATRALLPSLVNELIEIDTILLVVGLDRGLLTFVLPQENVIFK